MPATLSPVTYEPIRAVRVLSQQGALPQLQRFAEDATQTFQVGVPTRFVAGFIQECTFVGADVVAGVSSEKAKNYATAGGGVTFGLPPIVPQATDLNEPASGPPPNQPSATVIPIGAALRDGQMGIYCANGSTVFSISLKVGQVFVNTLIIPGTFYRLIKDTPSSFWYLDNTLTGGNAGVANLIGVDPSCPNTAAGGCRVFFTFAAGQRFFA